MTASCGWPVRGFRGRTWWPGRRLKMDARDLYAYGAHRGGIDERWIASTNDGHEREGRTPDEGLSFVVSGGNRFKLKDAIEAEGESHDRKRALVEVQALARLQQVLRQHGAHSSSPAPKRGASKYGGARR